QVRVAAMIRLIDVLGPGDIVEQIDDLDPRGLAVRGDHPADRPALRPRRVQPAPSPFLAVDDEHGEPDPQAIAILFKFINIIKCFIYYVRLSGDLVVQPGRVEPDREDPEDHAALPGTDAGADVVPESTDHLPGDGEVAPVVDEGRGIGQDVVADEQLQDHV